ncbi:MAG TPA: PEP-CTERM sorting domain-containing protein, partial [Terriglobales bacterium]|nr:PEP-CTERM sorting domain-containing protein [Terriglobales bacterium]
MVNTAITKKNESSMRPIIRLFTSIALLAGSSLLPVPAQATPFAGASALWSARTWYYSEPGRSSQLFPDGVTISCFGGAAGGSTGCSDHASLAVNDGSATISKISGLSITNTTDTDFDGDFVFRTDFSAFPRGLGVGLGASVDDPLTQYASFYSSVFGPGVNDVHGCNTVTGPFLAPNACGVSSPDSSQGDFFFGSLAAGQTLFATFNITIHAEVIKTPEPGTLALFGSGLLGAITMR